MATRGLDWAWGFPKCSGGGHRGGVHYDNTMVPWCSTEHMQDLYAASKYFGGSYSGKADGLKSEYLDNTAWDFGNKRWYGGGRRTDTGQLDTRDPLDVNAWGVLALGPSGTRDYRAALTYNLNRHRTTQCTGSLCVDAFDFNSDRNDIWYEGTGQMVSAFKVAGDWNNANYFLGQLIKGQRGNGGVPYSMRGTDNGYWTMSSAPAVASTGWLIIATTSFNPFKP